MSHALAMRQEREAGKERDREAARLDKERRRLLKSGKDSAKDIASHERFLFGSRPCLGTDRGDLFFWDLASVPVQQPSGMAMAAGHAGPSCMATCVCATTVH